MQLFGQTARRLGLATACQVQSLIALQRRLQKKFGMILVEKDLVDRYELQDLLGRFECHNASMSADGPCSKNGKAQAEKWRKE